MKEILANVVLIFAWMEAVFFVIAYHFKTNGGWRETPLGRNVMAMMAAVVALLGLAMLRTFVPWLQTHLQDLRLISFAVVAYIIGRRVQLLFRYQKKTPLRRSEFLPPPE